MQSKQLLKKYLNVIKGKLRSNTLLYQLSQNSIAMVWGNKVGTMLPIQVWGPEFQSLAGCGGVCLYHQYWECGDSCC